MTFNGWLQIVLYSVLVILLTKPFGGFMTKVFTGERTLLSAPLRPLETGIYRICRRRRSGRAALGHLCRRDAGVHLCRLRRALRAAAATGRCCRSIHRTCRRFPLTWPSTPRSASSPTPIGSRTCPKQTMSYLVQMAGLTVHNFVSAATGIALAVALIRGFGRRSAQTIGNFWVDMTRCVLYVLLPISIVVGLVLRLSGRAAEYRRLYGRRRRWKAAKQADRPGTGGVAGSDQDVGHERRRVLQRQLRASVREPDRR